MTGTIEANRIAGGRLTCSPHNNPANYVERTIANANGKVKVFCSRCGGYIGDKRTGKQAGVIGAVAESAVESTTNTED